MLMKLTPEGERESGNTNESQGCLKMQQKSSVFNEWKKQEWFFENEKKNRKYKISDSIQSVMNAKREILSENRIILIDF